MQKNLFTTFVENLETPSQMKRIYAMLLLLSLGAMSATAQKSAKKTNKVATPNKDNAMEQKLKQMTDATQKIVVFDSVVVDKGSFLTKYRLSPESGSILRYGDLFKADEQPNAYAYVNELANKCYFSEEDSTGNMALYTSDMIGKKWTKPTALKGLADDTGLKLLNYPFMLSDGLTLYFAAQGKESIGGYDIFVTRFDPESGSFLKPENVGMPFNSDRNDYMMAIDEQNNIGWFATDRNQTNGKVCIYMFIPSDSRQTYADDNLTERQLKSRAKLERIADTWGDGKEKAEALKRLNAISTTKVRKDGNGKLAFVVNDRTTYRSMNDFRTKEGKELMAKLQNLKAQHANLGNALDKARAFYSTANAADRKALTSEIIQSERQLESLETQMAQTEKAIRNAENKLSNK